MAEGDVPDGATPFQKALGLRWNVVEGSDAIAIEMDIRDDLRGPARALEGGVVSTLVDVAGASAVAFKAGMVATEHISILFLAPGRDGPVRATGTPLRVGKHDGVAEVRVVDLGRGERLMAVAQVTVRILGELRAAKQTVLLPGRVTRGIGGHAHWMTVHADLYEAKTGVCLHPGTLNVVLEREWHVTGDQMRLEPPDYDVPLSIVPCTINGLDAFIVRTDKNDRGEGDHLPNVVEVAAAVRLRDVLELEDGDNVEVWVGEDELGEGR